MTVKVHALVEMNIEVDERFSPLKTEWNDALTQELADAISTRLLAEENIVGLEAVFDETGEECLIEY